MEWDAGEENHIEWMAWEQDAGLQSQLLWLELTSLALIYSHVSIYICSPCHPFQNQAALFSYHHMGAGEF